jgi:hypothetical protein
LPEYIARQAPAAAAEIGYLQVPEVVILTKSSSELSSGARAREFAIAEPGSGIAPCQIIAKIINSRPKKRNSSPK